MDVARLSEVSFWTPCPRRPLAVAARLAFIMARPRPEPRRCRSATTEEMDLLLALAAPIDQALRPQFLQEVANEL